MADATDPDLARVVLAEVLENRRIAPLTWILKLNAPEVAPAVRAGQFVNLRTTESIVPLLRRPMSVHRVIRHGGHANGVAVLYDVIGPGTRALSHLKPGMRLDIVGPLGNAITVPPKGSRAVLVAGGVGVGPIKIVAEELQEAGVKDITVCYGARNQDHCVPIDEAAPHGCRVLVTTDDGSVGRKGFVTQSVADLIAQGRLRRGDYAFACGPVPMFRALRDLLAPHGIECEAATEEFMGCGFGVCNGCPVRQRQPDGTVRYRLCCADGCIFPLSTLVFEGDPVPEEVTA
jgi:dihydroorotate dehydrogenase electron transfer subunit